MYVCMYVCMYISLTNQICLYCMFSYSCFTLTISAKSSISDVRFSHSNGRIKKLIFATVW